MSMTIYHNPKCGTSRNTLEMIRKSGVEPQVIEYLKTPPSREELVDLIKRTGLPVRDILRQKGTPYDELGLGEDRWTDDQLIDFMMEHPILINRPIVVSEKGVRLCRPSEKVLDLLPKDIGSFTKEDGEVVSSGAPKFACRLEERDGGRLSGNRPGEVAGSNGAVASTADIAALWFPARAVLQPLPRTRSTKAAAGLWCGDPDL